jgi:hypothetical protein
MDPDPYVYGPPRFGTTLFVQKKSWKLGSGSRSGSGWKVGYKSRTASA